MMKIPRNTRDPDGMSTKKRPYKNIEGRKSRSQGSRKHVENLDVWKSKFDVRLRCRSSRIGRGKKKGGGCRNWSVDSTTGYKILNDRGFEKKQRIVKATVANVRGRDNHARMIAAIVWRISRQWLWSDIFTLDDLERIGCERDHIIGTSSGTCKSPLYSRKRPRSRLALSKTQQVLLSSSSITVSLLVHSSNDGSTAMIT